MQEINLENIIVQPITPFFHNEKNIAVSVLRLDLVHPVISGNKWFKLKYYIEEAKQQNKKRVITYGGAWSNHIIATACACSLNNLKVVGIIRGEEPAAFSATLNEAKDWGMDFIFLSRKDYQNKTVPFFFEPENDFIIPEGGYGITGAEGFSISLDFCNKKEFTHFVCAAGTGTMMAGIIKAATREQQVIGISVLKNNHDLLPAVHVLLSSEEKLTRFKLVEDYHFGGYAKHTDGLFRFMNLFYAQTTIPTDFVYTGKLFFGVQDLIKKNYFPAMSKVLVIHSGGLQGNTSLKKGTLIF